MVVPLNISLDGLWKIPEMDENWGWPCGLETTIWKMGWKWVQNGWRMVGKNWRMVNGWKYSWKSVEIRKEHLCCMLLEMMFEKMLRELESIKNWRLLISPVWNNSSRQGYWVSWAMHVMHIHSDFEAFPQVEKNNHSLQVAEIFPRWWLLLSQLPAATNLTCVPTSWQHGIAGAMPILFGSILTHVVMFLVVSF